MSLLSLQEAQTACSLCPRLVAWRESTAADPPLRYRGQDYWAKPVPSWGNETAKLVIIGLAPAAHGGNRTGRVFTGDRSGDWLFRAMWKAGFCNQPESIDRNDGLQLHDCYIAAACHCAPPDNKPTREELLNCRPFLLDELRLLTGMKILLGLGKIGFDAAFDAARAAGLVTVSKRPTFAHGIEAQISDTLILMGTYHPSQQNTFTGRLTEEMLDSIFIRAKELL